MSTVRSSHLLQLSRITRSPRKSSRFSSAIYTCTLESAEKQSAMSDVWQHSVNIGKWRFRVRSLERRHGESALHCLRQPSKPVRWEHRVRKSGLAARHQCAITNHAPAITPAKSPNQGLTFILACRKHQPTIQRSGRPRVCVLRQKCSLETSSNLCAMPSRSRRHVKEPDDTSSTAQSVGCYIVF